MSGHATGVGRRRARLISWPTTRDAYGVFRKVGGPVLTVDRERFDHWLPIVCEGDGFCERLNYSLKSMAFPNGLFGVAAMAVALDDPARRTSDQRDGQEPALSDINLADAKAQLSDLVERAIRREEVRITRRGKPVARLVGIERSPQPIDFAALRAHIDSMPGPDAPADSVVRAMRDDARY